MVRIVKLSPANDGKHKFVATFDDGRTTRFGALGADDFTKTGDEAQRARYRARHAKDLKTNDPHRAGYLSYYVLWGDSASLKKNVESFNRRFG
jgi:hypothetical protein